MGTGTPTVGRIEPEGAEAIEDKAGAANQVSGTGYMDQGVQGTNRGEAQLHGVRVFLCATCVLRVIETTNLEWPLPVAAVACVKASFVFGLTSSLRLGAPNRGEQGQSGRLPRWGQVMLGPAPMRTGAKRAPNELRG